MWICECVAGSHTLSSLKRACRWLPELSSASQSWSEMCSDTTSPTAAFISPAKITKHWCTNWRHMQMVSVHQNVSFTGSMWCMQADKHKLDTALQSGSNNTSRVAVVYNKLLWYKLKDPATPKSTTEITPKPELGTKVTIGRARTETEERSSMNQTGWASGFLYRGNM